MIAVLEGREAARDQYRDAVLLSADALLEARACQAPEASAHAYDDPRSLAEEFFPGQAAEVEAGAAALAARNRSRTLAEERTGLGLSQTEAAQRMGVPRAQVAAIERADPGTTEVRTLVSYVEALGGRLTVTADFGGDRVTPPLSIPAPRPHRHPATRPCPAAPRPATLHRAPPTPPRARLSRPVHHVDGEHVGLRLARYRWTLGPSVVQLEVADSV